MTFKLSGNFILATLVLFIFSLMPPAIISSINNLSLRKMNSNNTNRASLYSSVFNLTDADMDWVDSTLHKMSLRERCAQMIMPWMLGNFINEDSSEFLRITDLVKNSKVGGIVFFKGDILNEALIINKLQALSDVPLLIASDFERGLAMRLSDAIEFPYNMALSATGDEGLAYRMGKTVSRECRAIGVHQNYAPVADINSNAENPIINIRSYSENKDTVAKYCAAFIDGCKDERIITTVKHFPGHGNTAVDSHQDVPIITVDKDNLINNELVPFYKSIKAGAQSIMVGHLNVPAFETVDGLPATLSANIITDLLKNKMGFDGLIVTDAMNMNGVTKYFSVAQAAVMAIKAGNDILLMPPDEEIAINAIQTAVESGEINIERINHSVRKILAAKRWLKIDKHRFADIENLPKVINKKSHQKLALEIAEKSITLTNNDKKLIPIVPSEIHKTACITITEGMDSPNDIIFQNTITDIFSNVSSVVLNKKSTKRDFSKALKIAKQADLILLPSFIKVKAYQGTVSLSKKNTAFINKVLKLKTPAVIMSFGNPYLLSLFPKAKTYLCAYGDPPVSQLAMVKALLGEIDISGKLPISIPNTNLKMGDGIVMKKSILELNKEDIDTNYNFTHADE